MSRDRAKSGVNTRDRGRKFVAQLRCAAWLPRCRGRHQPVAAAFPAQILGNFATAPGDEPHECADPSRGACTGVMSRRWLSTRGASGFAAHAARTQPRVGAPAVEPPNNSTWRSSAPAGATEQMLSAAVTRRARAAGALKGPGAEKRPEQRPRSATYGRSPGWGQASGHEIWEGHGVARALSAAAVLTIPLKFRMDRRVSTLSTHRPRAP